MAPSSRFAVSLKPKVAYLDLNFCALWKKQTTSPSLAYAGHPVPGLRRKARVDFFLSAVEDRQVDPGQPLGVGEKVHLDDLAVPDRDRSDRERLSVAQ